MGVSKRRHPEGTARLRYLVRIDSPLTGRAELIGSGRDLNVATKFATNHHREYGLHIWVLDLTDGKTVFELARKERAAAGGAR